MVNRLNTLIVNFTSKAVAILLKFNELGPIKVSVYRSMVDSMVKSTVRNVRHRAPTESVHTRPMTTRVAYLAVT